MLLQILAAVSMATTGFLFVMVAGFLLKDHLAGFLSGRIPAEVFFKIVALQIPGMAPHALPIGVLTGVLLVLGRMSAQNEITAMKASGLSLWRICAPVVAVGLVASLGAAYVNFEYATWANARTKEIVAGTPESLLTERQAITKISGFTIYIGDRDNRDLRDVWVWRRDRAGREFETVRAVSGQIGVVAASDATGEASLPLTLRGVTVERRRPSVGGAAAEPVSQTHMEELRFDLPLGAALKAGDRKLRNYTLSELMELRDKGWKTTASSTPEARFADRIAVQLQIQSHLAGAFGIFSLTLLAIPLGIRVSRSETFVNLGVALALALSYYLMVVFVSWIKNPHLRPDLLVWIPNFVIQAVALRLIFKAART